MGSALLEDFGYAAEYSSIELIHENISSRLALKIFAPHRVVGFACSFLTLSLANAVAAAFWNARLDVAGVAIGESGVGVPFRSHHQAQLRRRTQSSPAH